MRFGYQLYLCDLIYFYCDNYISSSPRRSSKSSKTSKLHTPQAKSNKEKNSAVKMTPQERLKLKMQRALKKQVVKQNYTFLISTYVKQVIVIIIVIIEKVMQHILLSHLISVFSKQYILACVCFFYSYFTLDN